MDEYVVMEPLRLEDAWGSLGTGGIVAFWPSEPSNDGDIQISWTVHESWKVHRKGDGTLALIPEELCPYVRLVRPLVNRRNLDQRWLIVASGNLGGLFMRCERLAIIDGLADWDVSGATDMTAMFMGCKDLTDISPLARWDVSGVSRLTGMFTLCTSLSDISPLAGWDVSGARDLQGVFAHCPALEDPSYIQDWKVREDANTYKLVDDPLKLQLLQALWQLARHPVDSETLYGMARDVLGE